MYTHFVHLLSPQLKEPMAAGEGKERHILMSQWRQTFTEDNIIMDYSAFFMMSQCNNALTNTHSDLKISKHSQVRTLQSSQQNIQ